MNNIEFPNVIFVTGTGTDVGKSYATGWLAREINRTGLTCITQKFIQTGNVARSEDIELHRRIMSTGFFAEDEEQLTFPEVFSYPCSPDLASRIDGREINFQKIENATKTLSEKFQVVLVEGAGGIMVPLKNEYLTIDYIKEKKLPVIVVISGELGSINHALLTLFAVKEYELDLFAVVYNPFFDKDPIITEDTKKYLHKWIENRFPKTFWFEMPPSMNETHGQRRINI